MRMFLIVSGGLLALTACKSESCEPFFMAGCDAITSCAVCTGGGDCETWYEVDDREFTCNGTDNDRNGFEDCVDRVVDYACE